MNTKRSCAACGAGLGDDISSELCPACQAKRVIDETPTCKTPAPGAALSDGKPVVQPAAPSGDERPRPVLRSFGDYELLQEIARGGMGVVYKARQISLNRIVAVKMILAGEMADEMDIRRFRTEAEAAANLQHPNIVAIHEVGVRDGQHFFSMDYVEGRNLGAVAGGQPVPPRQAAEWVRTIAEAVHSAHQRGILHRDLKPQNILIDQQGQPRVTDFGLAKIAHQDCTLTHTGTVMGSPSYMAPEQASGRHDQVGPPSDVYSLGALLYELLTGHPPFGGENPMAILLKVMEEQAVAPTKLNSNLPRDLETICLKCLEKQPERRYHSARELAEELGRFLRHEPIAARRATFARRAWSWFLRHPWAISGLATLVILGLTSLAYGLWQQNRLLTWRLEHPGQRPPLANLFPDSATVGAVLVYSYLLLGVWPLADMRKRRMRGAALDRIHVLGYSIIGAAELAFGLFLALQWIRAFIWGADHYWVWPQMALLPPLSLFWFGTILLWHTVRERQAAISSSPSGAMADEPPANALDEKAAFFAFLLECFVLAGLFFLMTELHWYYRLTFCFLTLCVTLSFFSLSVVRTASKLLRPFWCCAALMGACFSIELFAKLGFGLAWKGALAGLLGGAMLVLASTRKIAGKGR